MADRRRKSGRRRPAPGFRPGKEPPEIRKRRAKQQLGEVNAAQERLIEVFAEHSPEEARKLIRRWRVGMLVAAVLLVALGAVLYLWSTLAGVLVHVAAAALLFLAWQIHRKRGDLETIADLVSGGGRG